jgi:hypothetical protein
MKVSQVSQEDVLYVLKIDASYIKPDADGYIFMAVINEDNEITGPIIENAYILGIIDGSVIGCEKNLVQNQLDEGIIEKISKEDYFGY